MPTLNFIETHRYNFPVTTTGTGVGLTTAIRSGDPYLVFLTQESFDDQFVYLMLSCDVEIARHGTPANRQTTGGIGYNQLNGLIYGAQGTSNSGIIYAIDPTTEAEVLSLDLSASVNFSVAGHGIATNGLVLALAEGSKLELRTMNGFLLGERDYPGRSIKGITNSPWSWTYVDSVNDEIVVINPFGNEIATAAAPGTPGGSQAVTFNNFLADENEPQQWICPLGTVDSIPGSIHNPDTPWSPVPWGGRRHRIYIANQTDQIIYAGYLS